MVKSEKSSRTCLELIEIYGQLYRKLKTNEMVASRNKSDVKIKNENKVVKFCSKLNDENVNHYKNAED